MILEMRHVYKDYQSGGMVVPVLKDICLQVKEGEYLAVMGPSGSGKSTLMNLIGCLDKPTKGELFLTGEDLLAMKENRLAEVRLRKIGFVFQNFQLLPRQSAAENVALPLIYAGVPRKKRIEKAKAALEKVGLAERISFQPNQLSGGQKQRVAIARAMVNEPKLLLADEPTSALDEANRDLLLDLLREYQQSSAILFISHDTEAMKALCPITHVMEHGKVIETQETEQLFLHPQQPWTKRFAAAACHREEVDWKWTALS